MQLPQMAMRRGARSATWSAQQQLTISPVAAAAMSPPAARSPPTACSLRGTPKTPLTPKTPRFFTVTPSSGGTAAAARMPSLLRGTTNSMSIHTQAQDSPATTPPPAEPDAVGPVLLGRVRSALTQAQGSARAQAQGSPMVASECSTCVAEDSPSYIAEQTRSAVLARMDRIASRCHDLGSRAIAAPVDTQHAIPTLLSRREPRQSAKPAPAQMAILLNGSPIHDVTLDDGISLQAFDKNPVAETLLPMQSRDLEVLAQSSAVQARNAFLDRHRRIAGRSICQI